MDAERVLAFRLARSGLAARAVAVDGAPDLAAAAACPASDFSRDAALLALAARAEGVTRAAYDGAVDAGESASSGPVASPGAVLQDGRLAALRGTPQLSLVIA